ncbi:MAG TPA: hypothetical protein VFI71_12400, partial [Pyrinomonadaceae bacterium]|nr:hypothetical protein [Pyrinomonadaceae bacterium]
MDFDGVIHRYDTPWTDATTISDPPVDGAISFLLTALEHFDVVIYSSRSKEPGGVHAMETWLHQHAGACWHETPDGPGLESVRYARGKPPAFLTIDDRAFCFEGTWPDVHELLKFKPWNKR